MKLAIEIPAPASPQHLLLPERLRCSSLVRSAHRRSSSILLPWTALFRSPPTPAPASPSLHPTSTRADLTSPSLLPTDTTAPPPFLTSHPSSLLRTLPWRGRGSAGWGRIGTSTSTRAGLTSRSLHPTCTTAPTPFLTSHPPAILSLVVLLLPIPLPHHGRTGLVGAGGRVVRSVGGRRI